MTAAAAVVAVPVMLGARLPAGRGFFAFRTAMTV